MEWFVYDKYLRHESVNDIILNVFLNFVPNRFKLIHPITEIHPG